MLDERADFVTELLVSRPTVQHTAQHGSQTKPQASHAPSRTFSTAEVMDFQFSFSRANCFCPAFVIV